MAKTNPKPAEKGGQVKTIDRKIKWLVGLTLITAALFVFLKSPSAEKLGLNLEGMSSDASYGKDGYYYADETSDISGKDIQFDGGPVADCSSSTGCLDQRLQITAPDAESRILPRGVREISWTYDESIEARYHQISIHGIGCGSNCPEPFIIVDRYRGQPSYSWQIGSFLSSQQGGTVPQELQNVPVWLRVTTQGLYRDGAPANYYNQIPVVLSQYR